MSDTEYTGSTTTHNIKIEDRAANLLLGFLIEATYKLQAKDRYEKDGMRLLGAADGLKRALLNALGYDLPTVPQTDYLEAHVPYSEAKP